MESTPFAQRLQIRIPSARQFAREVKSAHEVKPDHRRSTRDIAPGAGGLAARHRTARIVSWGRPRTRDFEPSDRAAGWSRRQEHADTHDADPSPESNMGYFRPSQIVAALHVLKLLNDRRVLEKAELYLGCTPLLDNLGCWWSFGGRTAAKGTQRHQRDLDRLRGFKLSIYLNKRCRLLLATPYDADPAPNLSAAPILLTLPAGLDPEINRLISAV